MNRKITLSLAAITLLVLSTWTAQLSAQSEEQIKRFNEEREIFYTEKLELTEKESEAFWPIYNDFHNRKMKLMKDERNTFRYCHKNADNLTDEEFLETLEKVRKLKDDQHKLEQEYYHNRFLEALPPRKVMLLYKVEWDFRGYLIRQLRGDGQGPHGRRGGRPDSDRGPKASPPMNPL
ncbi:MAG: hypothetical protein KAR19_12105 [Bacteroidales bacterium]|nr:hypothetical protein [Bacteroidales bacterium]